MTLSSCPVRVSEKINEYLACAAEFAAIPAAAADALKAFTADARHTAYNQPQKK